MKYLVPLAHLLHLTPNDVDALTWREFEIFTDWIDEYLERR